MTRDETKGMITCEPESVNFLKDNSAWKTIPKAGKARCQALVFCDAIDYLSKTDSLASILSKFQYCSRDHPYFLFEGFLEPCIIAENLVNQSLSRLPFRKEDTLFEVVNQLFYVLIPNEIHYFEWGLLNLEYFRYLLPFMGVVKRKTGFGPDQEQIAQKIRSTNIFQEKDAVEKVGRQWYSCCVGAMLEDIELTESPDHEKKYRSQLDCIKLVTGITLPTEFVRWAYDKLESHKKKIKEIIGANGEQLK